MSDVSELLTVPDAAKVAGVSERTMRRWATTGHVRTVGRGHKRRVLAVSLSEPSATNGQAGHEGGSPERPVSATPAIESATAAEADRLADLVRELTGRVSDLSATAAMWQTRAQMLDERVRALEAPKPDPAPDPFPEPIPPTPNAAPWDARWQARVTIAAAVLAGLALVAGLAPTWVR